MMMNRPILTSLAITESSLWKTDRSRQWTDMRQKASRIPVNERERGVELAAAGEGCRSAQSVQTTWPLPTHRKWHPLPLPYTQHTHTTKMSATGEDTFEEEGDMEEMDNASSDDDDEGVEMDEERADEEEGETKVYVPGIEPLQPGEELEMDRSAYRMYHECQTGTFKHKTLKDFCKL